MFYIIMRPEMRNKNKYKHFFLSFWTGSEQRNSQLYSMILYNYRDSEGRALIAVLLSVGWQEDTQTGSNIC